MIAVTGATGFIGGKLVRRLAREKKNFICLVRPGSARRGRLSGIPAPFREVDFDSAGAVADALAGCDVLVHAAGLINGTEDRLRKANADLTANLAAAARRAGVKKIVFVSSVAAMRRHGFYGETKHLAEEAIRGSGIPYFILRPAFTYGTGDRHNTGLMIETLKKFPVIPLLGGGTFSLQPVYVDDVIEVLARMIDRPAPDRAYAIAGPAQVTLAEILTTLARHLNVKRFFLPVPLAPVQWFLRRYVRIFKNTHLPAKQILELDKHEAFDISDTVRDFGLTPLGFGDGVRKMFEAMPCAE